jgi:superfamily II DNA/RNA helicase
MYDPDTAALITSSPSLPGLNLQDLPQRLTNAYASIVANRVRLRSLATRDVLPDDLQELIEEIKRIAFTNEALVSAVPSRNDRVAAAFVAASAHHVWQMSERLSQSSAKSTLAIDHISPEVSATLLFLIAEAAADASEIAKTITFEANDSVESLLLGGIRLLALGQLEGLAKLQTPNAGERPLNGVEAHRRLLEMLVSGLRILAEDILSDSATPGGARATQAFEHVKRLCIERIEGGVAGAALAVDTFAGAFHLASLLSAVAGDLASSALTKLPPPTGIEAGRWGNLIKEIAKRRPYIWRNHRQAIAKGYLERGNSAVVSFPTGAGKSTLAELKIAVSLLRGEKVVFLVPTLALVDQTARALKTTFRAAEVQREKWEALTFDDLLMEELPEISVMTPERCLAMLAFDRTVFDGVGLLVFDECHLLHPGDLNRSRRALDAMLCLLNFLAASANSDLLLMSAMMKNGDELAGWLANVTERNCMSLNLTWKPTRQVRGCVIYDATEIQLLRSVVQSARSKAKTKGPTTGLKGQTKVRPFGLFCLRQTWQSQARKDYAFIPLLDSKVLLGISGTKPGSWYLTPNANHVASKLAAATASLPLKTLVFVQDIRSCDSVAESLCDEIGSKTITLSEDELRLLNAATAELGDASHLYVTMSDSGQLESACLPHHGLLLPAERQLHEAIFRRPDGIDVLIATSTLAQGMNLPSEVVIIAGDSRFEPSANRIAQLEAHELLNAAGRAGRAGEDSHGFVLIVPSKVVDFEKTTNKIDKHWMDLKAIFSQSDQCLDIEDPIAPLLDEIHVHTATQSSLVDYLITRLPHESSAEEEGDAQTAKFLSKTLGSYRARARGDIAWIDQRIASALAFRKTHSEGILNVPWAERLSAAVGFPAATILALGEELGDVKLFDARDVTFWADWLFAWLTRNPEKVAHVIRSESLEAIWGSGHKALSTDADRGRLVLPMLGRLLKIWLQGGPLSQMEAALGITPTRIGKCKKARQFVLRVIPDLGYFFGLPFQVLLARAGDAAEETMPGLGLSTLGACVREGFDRSEKLALRQIMKGSVSRVAIHKEFAKIEPYLQQAAPFEDLAMAVDRVKAAMARYRTANS